MKTQFTILVRVLAFFWPKGAAKQKWQIIIAVAAMLFSKLIIVAIPVLYKTIIDEFTNLADKSQGITSLVMILILVYALGRFASVALIQLRDLLFVGVLHSARRALATDSFRRILNLDYNFFLQNKVGEIQQKIERGIRAVSSMTDYLLFSIAPTLFEITTSAIVIAVFLSPLHALVVAGCAAIYIAFTIITTQWRIQYRKAMNAADNTAKGIAVDAVMNVEIIKLHSAETFEAQRYQQALTDYEDKSVASGMTLAVVNLGQAAIIAFALIFVLLTVGNGVLNGTYSIGQFAMINIYLLQVFTPLGMLGFVYRQVHVGLTDLAGMFEMIDAQLPQQGCTEKTEIDCVTEVRLDQVDFTFPEQASTALHNISLTIERGKVLGIVGPTGAGKSTLLRLIFGLHRPQKGQVLVDDQPLSEIDLTSYRRRLAIVPQDTILFHDTLRRNIAYGDDDIADSQILAAAQQAEISHDLLSTPEDLDRIVGERGGSISGGQRQRVALARALLRKPDILVLDEATSALDAATESKIIERTYKLAAESGLAVVIVTHKMRNVANAERILVIENGHIIKSGSHAELFSDKADKNDS